LILREYLSEFGECARNSLHLKFHASAALPTCTYAGIFESQSGCVQDLGTHAARST
jgi:hypothetical protein